MLFTDLEIRHAVALRAIEGDLLRLRWLAAATRCELAMHRHMLALKYGYNPAQPRVPRGNPDGGQWTATDANGDPVASRRVRLAGDVPTNDPPEVPKERPKTSSERVGWLKAAARMAAEQGVAAADIAKLSPWMTYYAAGLQSYNDPPRSLDELQTTTPGPGYDIHHIVEQSQAEDEGYSRETINSSDNLVVIPRMKHWEINQWYQTKNDNFGGETPREYLEGRSWAVKRAVGLEALKNVGVLKP